MIENKYNLAKNVNLYTFNTNKYKDINVFMYFTGKYNPNNKVLGRLLNFFVGSGSKKYPTKQDYCRQVDLLYDAKMVSSYSNSIYEDSLLVNCNFINPKYLNDVSINDFIEFYLEMIKNCLFNEELLKEYKDTLKDNLIRSLEKNSSYASQRCGQIINKDNNFGVTNIDLLDKIEPVKLSDVVNFYNHFIYEGNVDIYVVGDVDNNLINSIKSLNFKDRQDIVRDELKFNFTAKEEMIVDNKDVEQSELRIFYKTPFNRDHKDFYAWNLCDYIIGGGASSLLFNNVREKLSLCYSIYMTNDKEYGLSYVATSIDNKNLDITLKEVNKQLETVKNGEISDDLISTCKLLFSTSLQGIEDDIKYYIDYLYMNSRNKTKRSIDEYIAGINKVSKQDLIKVINQYEPYFIYELKGNKHE